MFVSLTGLVVGCDTLDLTPKRHFAAFLIGLAPGLCNWALTEAENLARFVTNPGVVIDWSNSGQELYGMWLLGQGYLLTSIIWSATLLYVIDRKYVPASLWMLIAAALSLVGFIHSLEIGFLVQVGEHGWKLCVGYVVSAAFLYALHECQKRGWVLPPYQEPMEDERLFLHERKLSTASSISDQSSKHLPQLK